MKHIDTAKHKIHILVFVLYAGLYAVTSHADWSVAGAQYSCNSETGEFVLLPHDESSDGMPPLENGFIKLLDEESNLACKLGKRKLKVLIHVYPPASHGMCAGGGLVAVESIIVDSVELLKKRIDLDFSCWGSDPAITKITVRNNKNSVLLEQTQTIRTDQDYSKSEIKVGSENFDVDSISEQNAKIDNKQDNPQYQQEHFATKLPPENDLANVFQKRFPKESNIPLCAHWHSLFLSAVTAPDKQRHGHISGINGEKIYMHRANPQICELPDDDGCTGKSYLIPGDRVDVGFVCGEWTYIQYESRVRTKPHTQGWVETNRLYDVDSVSLAQDPKSSVSQKKVDQEQLLIAIKDGNLNEVNKLLAAGNSPNGIEQNGLPIGEAIKANNPDIVKALIKAGADVNLGKTSCYRITNALDNDEIFDAIVNASANLNCRDKVNFSQTILMSEAMSSLFLWWQYRYEPIVSRIDLPWRDPAVRVRKLVNAGADIKALDSAGKNVLFYATESNNVDTAEALLELGADPNVTTDNNASCESCGQQEGSTPLMSALRWYELTYDPTMFRILLKHGADPNYRNQSQYNSEWDATTQGAVTFAGQTVLTRAAEDGYYTLARLALEHGADPTLPREDGKTPEEIAREYKHPNIAELIERHTKTWKDKRATPINP
jgi:hypothetical protein